MRFTTSSGTIGAAVSLYTAGALAATASNCVGGSDDVCFAWGVPEAVASSGSGNVYFQLEAPDTYSWIGLGIGSQMKGAEIFLIYQDGQGNVTLSYREGKGHAEPEHADKQGIELLAGSGVVDGKMTANVKCSSCDSLDTGSTNSWIAAWLEGDALDSTDVGEEISRHSGKTIFSVDFSKATVASDTNPFVAADTTGGDQPSSVSGSSPSSTSGAESPASSGDSNGAISDESDGDSDGGVDLSLTHGIIMTIAFAFMYPVGALLQPLVRKWYIHASWQMIAFLLMWAGFGIGYHISNGDGTFFKNSHTRLGTVVVAMLAIQPVLGSVHHAQFKKTGSRGLFSHWHIWYGRILMVIGVVNGGLGLRLASASTAFIVAYSVVAGVFFVAYLGAILFGMVRKPKAGKAYEGSPASGSRQTY